MARSKTIEKSAERDLKLLSGTSEQSKIARCLIQAKQDSMWNGYQYVPPLTILDTIIREFEKKSHAPLEIPFFVTLEILATLLLQKNVRLKINGVDSLIDPQLWIFLLADSGSMKSMTFREILKWSGLKKDDLIWNLNGIAGPAGFVKELVGSDEDKSKNRTLAVIEEAGEFRKKMTVQQGPLSELVSYFLMIYDHEQIKRSTKHEKISIEEPCLNILGFSVPEPFIDGITAEEMLSGFMQRHSIVFAEPSDRKRHPIIQLNLKRTSKEWEKIISLLQHNEYIVGSKALREFKKIYKRLISEFDNVPDSFSLRIMWTCHTYALLYHIILGDGKEKDVSAKAYAYAERLTKRALSDMTKAFQMTLHSETYKKIMKAEELKKKQNGRLTARDIYRNFRDIRPGEADLILKIINESCVLSKNEQKGVKIGGRPNGDIA